VIQALSKMFVYHEEVGDKENEIRAIPRALKMIDIKGKMITIDAIGTQKSIMKMIIRNGGDFLFAVKGNQENLEAEVADWVETAITGNEPVVQKYVTNEKNGGRRERREYFFIQTNECIGDPEIRKMVKGIGKVYRHMEEDLLDSEGNVKETKESEQTVYYITSKRMDVRAFAGFIRRHWVVEACHNVYDHIFLEDRCRARKGNARMNTSLMRKLAYNILLLEKKKRPPDVSFEFVQDELRYNLEVLCRYFFCPTEKISK
jgi:predicted transposase YbfD/YdcC